MRRSQQKQDELLQQMLDRSSDPSTGQRSQRQNARDSTRNKYLRAEAKESSGNENVDLEGTLKPYQESEIREIKMFGDVADVTAPRERPARTRQLKNPYLKPRTAADGPKERSAPVR